MEPVGARASLPNITMSAANERAKDTNAFIPTRTGATKYGLAAQALPTNSVLKPAKFGASEVNLDQ